MTAPRIKQTFRLPPDLARDLARHAQSRRVSQAAVVEAALCSFLSPDGADRLEAAISRRLDRLNRHLDRLEWNDGLTNEMVALFIRSWLASTPPIPDETRRAAHAQGRERWEDFVAMLSRRMESDFRLLQEIGQDVAPSKARD